MSKRKSYEEELDYFEEDFLEEELKEEDLSSDVCGYCSYCKNEILRNQNFVSKNGKIFHMFCYKQMNNGIEDFDE